MKANSLLCIPVFTGLFFGYHLGVIGPTLPILQKTLQLSHWQAAHLVSLFIAGLILGSLLLAPLLKKLNPVHTLIFVASLIGIQSCFGFYAHYFYQLLVYRLLTGTACGMAAVLGPMLCVANAPTAQRAKLTSYFQMCIALGVLISYSMGLIFFEKVNVVFGLSVLIAFGAFYYFFKLKGLKKQDDVKGYFFKRYSKSYFIALGLNFFQQASGINAITFFIQTLLSEGLDRPQKNLYLLPIVVNLVSMCSTALMLKKVDTWGRKPFLILGTLGMGLCMLILSLGFLSFLTRFITLLIFTLCFSSSLGPLTYLMMNEVFHDKIRARAVSLAFVINCLTNYSISLIFLPLRHQFGPLFMWGVFAATNMVSLGFICRFIPETKGKKLDNFIKKINSG
jgi:MFS family permease